MGAQEDEAEGEGESVKSKISCLVYRIRYSHKFPRLSYIYISDMYTKSAWLLADRCLEENVSTDCIEMAKIFPFKNYKVES